MDAKSHCNGGANLRTRSPGPDEYLHEWAADLVPSADDSLLGLDLSQSCQAPNCIGAFSVASRVRPETLFQIGSLTRTNIGIAIWRLIVEGALSLDAPVHTHLPDLTLMDDAVAAEVTVANLLDYSAGWYGDEGFETGNGEDAIACYVAERLPQLPQIFALGAFFSYNNAAFTLIGRLIEVATGTTYNAAMEHLLLGPLGLEDSLLDNAAVLKRPYADGHVAMPINGHPALAVQTPLWFSRSLDPAGGVWATRWSARRVWLRCVSRRFPFPGSPSRWAGTGSCRTWLGRESSGTREIPSASTPISSPSRSRASC
jgi:CubicO group peptidase (beta-lactamase class C family)